MNTIHAVFRWKIPLFLLVLILFAASNSSLAQQQVEVQISTMEIVDFEFDWGRDGNYCAICNQGAGNTRLTFTDRRQRLWVGSVDTSTGDFIPPDGRDVLVDTDASVATTFGNGPEWMTGPEGSRIAFTKYLPEQPQTPENTSLALATLTPSGWTSAFLEGAEQKISPLGSMDVDDPQPRLVYAEQSTTNIYWRYALDAASETLIADVVGTAGASRRWVPGRQEIIFTKTAPSRFGGPGLPQVFIYDLLDQQSKQLTFDANTKWGAFMWAAPEYDGEQVMFALVNLTRLVVYREIVDRRGRLRWRPVASISGTTELPFIWSPEPFVHNGHSYIMMQLSSSPDPSDMSIPTHIAIAGIDPEHLSLQLLTDESGPPMVRIDPEYFITESGPFIYYPRYVPLTDTTPLLSDGVWRIDTGLGPPVNAPP